MVPPPPSPPPESENITNLSSLVENDILYAYGSPFNQILLVNMNSGYKVGVFHKIEHPTYLGYIFFGKDKKTFLRHTDSAVYSSRDIKLYRATQQTDVGENLKKELKQSIEEEEKKRQAQAQAQAQETTKTAQNGGRTKRKRRKNKKSKRIYKRKRN